VQRGHLAHLAILPWRGDGLKRPWPAAHGRGAVAPARWGTRRIARIEEIKTSTRKRPDERAGGEQRPGDGPGPRGWVCLCWASEWSEVERWRGRGTRDRGAHPRVRRDGTLRVSKRIDARAHSPPSLPLPSTELPPPFTFFFFPSSYPVRRLVFPAQSRQIVHHHHHPRPPINPQYSGLRHKGLLFTYTLSPVGPMRQLGLL